MTIDLISSALGGFSLTSSLVNRTLEGFWSSTSAFFVNFDFPLSSVIQSRVLTSVVQARTLTSEVDQ